MARSGEVADADIAAMEAFYADRGQDAVVHVNAAVDQHLDEMLAARGYVAEAPSVVMTAALPKVMTAAMTAQSRRSSSASVHLSARRDAAWTGTAVAIEPRPDAVATFELVLDRIAAPTRFALAAVGEESSGVGVGILDGRWLGISSVATASDQRRQGIARAVAQALCAWGASEGADAAWLQVERDNTAARALYAALGFTDRYAYSYRRLPFSSGMPRARPDAGPNN